MGAAAPALPCLLRLGTAIGLQTLTGAAPPTTPPATETEPVLVLASASPRRRELLRYLGVPFTAIATTAEEEQHPEPPDSIRAALPPFPLDRDAHPTLVAWRKASAGAERGYRGLVLGADTIVVIDGTILGKPRDETEARTMLRMLAGRTHSVYTGIALLDARTEARCLFDLFAPTSRWRP